MKSKFGLGFLAALTLIMGTAAYNGSGTFDRVHSWADDKAASIAITASRMDAEDDGFATGLSNAITKDGQTVITADIPFATKKITGLGVGSANTDSLTLGQSQNGGFLYAGTGGGTADVITLTMNPVVTALVAGQKFRFLASGANTTAVTVNVNNIGAKALKKNGGTALTANDIPAAGAVVEIVYDGTDFEYSNIDTDTTLTNAILINGTATVTANIPFATFKLTGVGSGTARTDAFNIGNLQDGGFVDGGTGGGTVDVITLSLSPAITAYASGQKFRFLALGANTTTVTVNINGVGAKALKKQGGTALAAGDIPAAGAVVEIVYDGTDFEYSNLSGSSSSAVVLQVVNTQTGAFASTTSNIPFDDTIPQKTEGGEVMTLAITPNNTANKLKIDVVAFVSNNAGANNIGVALFQDTTAGALAAGSVRAPTSGVSGLTFVSFTHFMTAGTVSSTTFKVRIGADSSTTVLNGGSGVRRYGGVSASSITITEIEP